MSRGRKTTVARLYADDSGHHRDEWQEHLSGRTGDAPNPCASRSRKGVCSAQPRCCSHADRRWYVQSLRGSQEPEADGACLCEAATLGGIDGLPLPPARRLTTFSHTDPGMDVRQCTLLNDAIQ
jgi:hypothetical protein